MLADEALFVETSHSRYVGREDIDLGVEAGQRILRIIEAQVLEPDRRNRVCRGWDSVQCVIHLLARLSHGDF